MLSVSFCRLFRLYIMSMILLVSSLSSKTKYFQKSCSYYLCFYFSLLSPFLWHFSSEHSAQVYGTVRSLMTSPLPFGLSVHCTSPIHSLVPAAPSFPSCPGQYVLPCFPPHSLYPSVCSAGLSAPYVFVLPSLLFEHFL